MRTRRVRDLRTQEKLLSASIREKTQQLSELIANINSEQQRYDNLIASNGELVKRLEADIEYKQRSLIRRTEEKIGQFIKMKQTLLEELNNDTGVKCAICCMRNVDSVFIGCGHSFCADCAQKIQRRRKCCVCNIEIKRIQKLYLI